MTQQVKKSKNDNYSNYKLKRNLDGKRNKIDVIELEDPKITKEWFFENYIKPRKPVVIKYKKSKDSKLRLNVDDFKPDKIIDTLNHDDNDNYLQVEELNGGGFGSGQKRLKLKLKEFLDRVKEGESLYLTTQYAENNPDLIDANNGDEEEKGDMDDDYDDNDNDDGEDSETGFPSFAGNFSDTSDIEDMHDDFDDEELNEFKEEMENNDEYYNEIEIDPIYQPPLSKLLNGRLDKLPPHPLELTEPLVPQQINMWFGRTPNDTKQLKITCKDNKISINKGLPTKNSTSTGLHHDHADNIYILIQGKKRFTLFSPDFAHDLYTTGDVRCIYDTGVIDYVCNDKATGWNNIRADGGCVDLDNNKEKDTECKKSIEQETEKQDPPSFCKIPPSLLHLNEVEDKDTKEKLIKYCKQNLPKFYELMDSSVKVTLEDGDLLYLPAGWFHEVTSFGDEDRNNTHIAINYWFVPPDGVNIDKPYSDTVWEEDFKAWKEKYL